MRPNSALLACAIAVLLPSAAPADDAALLDRVQQLEARVAELEQERAERPLPAPPAQTNEPKLSAGRTLVADLLIGEGTP